MNQTPGTEKTLIVGAAGQVGRQLARQVGGYVIHTSRTPKNPEWYSLDLADLARDPSLAVHLIRTHNFTQIYCVGGATDVEGCENNEAWATDVNCHGPVALAAASQHIPFIYFSTEYVFNGLSGPYDEDSVPCPISAYGRSKLMGEQRILDTHPNPLIVRTTVVYGPDPGEKNFLYALRRALLSGKVFRVADDQISTPTFNVDLAAATVALIEADASGVFHVCGSECLSRYDFAVRAATAMDLDPAMIRPVSTADLGQKAARPLRAGLSTRKLQQHLPHVSMRTIEEGVQAWISEEYS